MLHALWLPEITIRQGQALARATHCGTMHAQSPLG
jgi:hypothetical protein